MSKGNATVQAPADETKRSFDIALVGELNLDLILYGLPREMAMERELLANGFSMTLGSSSAILAHNICKLGCATRFLGTVGNDAMGAIAIERLREAGVDTSRITLAQDGTSTGVTVLLPHGRERHILTYQGTMAALNGDDVDEAFLLSSRHLHLSSLFLQSGLRPHVPDLFRRARVAGLSISLDTNDDPDDRWEGVDELLSLIDLLLPSEAEACRMTRCTNVEEALEVLAAHVPLVAVKCGAEGALIAQGAARIRVPGIPVEPLDTIGAGDSFNAGFLSAFLQGRDAETCGIAGNLCGALSTLRSGGTEAFRDDALRESFLREHNAQWMERGT